MKQFTQFFSFLQDKNWRAILFLSIVTFSVHSPVLFNGYNLDDELVTRNHGLTSEGISAIPEIYKSPYYEDDMGYSYGYRPTVLASFAIEHELFGESPFVGHLINLLLYALTIVVIFKLVLFLFPGRWWLAFGTALLFAVHPIHTEVVASLKNRDEILALLFGLTGLSLAYYENKRYLLLIPSLAFFILSLTSKMSGIMLLLAVAIIPRKNRSPFADIALVTGFSLAMFYCFQMRGISDYHVNHIVLFILTFGIIRISTMSWQKDFLRKQISEWISVLLRFFSPFIRVIDKSWTWCTNQVRTMVESLASRFSKFQLLEMIISSVLFLILMSEDKYLYWFKDESAYVIIASVVVSMVLIPSKVGDGFFRFSFVHLYLGSVSAYMYGAILFFGSMSVLNRSTRSVIRYHLIGIGIVIVIVLLPSSLVNDQSALINAGFTQLSVFIIYVSKSLRTRFQLLITGIIALVLSIVSVSIEAVTYFDAFLYTTLICAPIWLGFVLRVFKFLNTAFTTVLEKPKHSLVPVVSCSAVILLTSLFLSHRAVQTQKINHGIYLIELNSAATRLANKYMTQRESEEFNPNEVWSSKHLQSWGRPFDFVEHPLSPFAPKSWKIGTALTTLGTYFQKLVIPYPLAFYYGFDEVTISNLWQFGSVIPTLIHAMLLVGILFFWRRARAVSIGLFMYLSCIALFSGMAEMVAGMYADRYAYTASFGFCLTLVGLGQYIFSKRPKTKTVVVSIFSLTLISFSVYSFNRNQLWEDKITLMRHDIKHVPNSAQGHNLLGHALMEDAFSKENNQSQREKELQIKEALGHFERATEIYPNFFNAWVDQGKVNGVLERYGRAIIAFEMALTIDTGFYPVYNWLGNNYEEIGNFKKAALQYQQFLKKNPMLPEAYNNLARVYYKNGEFRKALEVCELYLAIDPSNSSLKQNAENIRRILRNGQEVN